MATTDSPVLVGQRITRVRRMTALEQSKLGLEPVRKPGPVVLELESGVTVYAVSMDDVPGKLASAKDDVVHEVTASSVEVQG